MVSISSASVLTQHLIGDYALDDFTPSSSIDSRDSIATVAETDRKWSDAAAAEAGLDDETDSALAQLEQVYRPMNRHRPTQMTFI